MNINTAHIAGRVTKKPELRKLPSGSSICTFSLATNHVYKKESGEKIEEVEFHNIVTFGKTAETIAQYVEQGQVLYVEGRIKTEKWEKDEVKHNKTTIIAEKFQFGERSKNSTPRTESTTEIEEEVDGSEDIPF